MITKEGLIVPKLDDSEETTIISLRKAFSAEGRQEEVAFVTKEKAPELLKTFNEAWSEVHKAKVRMMHELDVAKKMLNKRKGHLVLYTIPERLKVLDLSNSVDVREAIISEDEEYEHLNDTVDKIKCMIEFLNGKLKSFDNSFSSVKKIMSEDGYIDRYYEGDTSVPENSNTNTPIGRTSQYPFGKAKV